jgi:hypothetical protein
VSLNEETGKVIREKVGRVLKVDVDVDDSAVSNYLRVRVQVDVRKPLLRGVFLEKVTSGGRDWCPIQYEFLPNFCYGCGLLGHVYKECDASVGKEEDQQYGDWMQASPVRKKGFVDSRSRWSMVRWWRFRRKSPSAKPKANRRQ